MGVQACEVARNLASDARPVQAQARVPSEGDVAALVKSMRGTIRWVVHQFGRGLDGEVIRDLLAAGDLGAIEAARRYDPSRGVSFSTYATYWVRAFVVKEVFFFWGQGRCRVCASTMRVFFGHGRARRKIEAAGQDPTPAAVAKAIGVPVATLEAAWAASMRDRGYDDPPRGDSVFFLNETLSDERASALDLLCDRVDRVGVEEGVRAALNVLDARSRYVIEQRFYEGKKLREVAETLRLTKQGAQQIEKRAIARLRRHLDRTSAAAGK